MHRRPPLWCPLLPRFHCALVRSAVELLEGGAVAGTLADEDADGDGWDDVEVEVQRTVSAPQPNASSSARPPSGLKKNSSAIGKSHDSFVPLERACTSPYSPALQPFTLRKCKNLRKLTW
eukprot:8985006-Pyramimonas_sp.AAC.2